MIKIQTFSLQETLKWTFTGKGPILKSDGFVLPYNEKTSFTGNAPSYLLDKNKNKSKEIQYMAWIQFLWSVQYTGDRDVGFYSMRSKEIWKTAICVVTCNAC